MTTNDKPVCYQIRCLYSDGAGFWGSHDTSVSRDLLAESWDARGVKYETRDLYARPQPADDDLHRHLLDMLGVSTHEQAGAEIARLHLAAMRPQPAAPQVPDDATCEAVYDAVTRASLTRDVKSPERKREIVRASLTPPPEAPQAPDNEVCNTLPIDVRGKWYSVPVPVHLHIIALRDALATPPASSPQVPEGSPSSYSDAALMQGHRWEQMRCAMRAEFSKLRLHKPHGDEWKPVAQAEIDWILSQALALATPPAPEQPQAVTVDAAALAHVFGAGYDRGHERTVEGIYRDVPHGDRVELFSESAAEVYQSWAEQPKPQPSDHCAIMGCVHKQHGSPTWPEGSNPFQPKPAGDVEADAARYRWLRQGHENICATKLDGQLNQVMICGGELDTAVDQARLAAQPAQGEVSE